MKTEYNALFDKITPARSDDELLLGVLGKAEKMDKKLKKSIKKPLIAVCAASLAVCGAVTAVGAYCGWDFNKVFGAFFKPEPSYVQQAEGAGEDNAPEELFNYDFEKQGKVIDRTFELNGYDLHIKGVTATDTSVCMVLDVIFGEDFPFSYGPESREYSTWRIQPVIDVSGVDPEATWGCGTNITQPQINGNVFTYMITVNVHGVSIGGRTVTFDFEKLTRNIKIFDENGNFLTFAEEPESVDCGVSIEIPIDFIDTAGTIRKEVGREATMHDGTTVFIERIIVSPFMISAEYTDSKDSPAYIGDEFVLTLDDGTKLYGIDRGGSGSSNGETAEYSIYLTSPVNTDLISSVTIGSLTISLKDGEEPVTEDIEIIADNRSTEVTSVAVELPE
ncbi:MAG: hypothetical protein ACI4J7_07015 [Ruminiclostridium sp.]